MSKAFATTWGHNALAHDLALKLRHDGKNWTWENATIGAWSGPRPDVMSFRRFQYDQPQIHAYEIKVTRADLLSDLNSDKWRKYLEHCQTVTFAMPSGLCTRDEIPAECGVMFRTGRGWRTERRATNVGSACSIQAMAKLLTMHPHHDRVASGGENRYAWAARSAYEKAIGKRYGRELASHTAAVAEGHDPMEAVSAEAEKIRAEARGDADKTRRELSEILQVLGVDPKVSAWQLRHELRRIVDDLRADSLVSRIESALANAERALADARSTIPEITETEAA